MLVGRPPAGPGGSGKNGKMERRNDPKKSGRSPEKTRLADRDRFGAALSPLFSASFGPLWFASGESKFAATPCARPIQGHFVQNHVSFY